jgi:hypothetical protein
MTTTRTKPVRDWACQECRRKMTAKAAERATSQGCPKCGGTDIQIIETVDLMVALKNSLAGRSPIVDPFQSDTARPGRTGAAVGGAGAEEGGR